MAESTVALEQPTVTSAPRRLVLFRHEIVDHADLGRVIPASFGELYGAIGRSDTHPAGPPFVVYRTGSQVGVRWDIDICAPVAGPMTEPPGFEFTEMPVGTVLSLLYVGPYEGLGKAYGEIESYITEHGLQQAGPPREFYFSEPDVPPSQTRTMIEWPVAELSGSRA